MKFDPVEQTPEYIEAMKTIQPQLNDMALWVSPDGIWAKKKELLKKKGIDWKTPREMNPGVRIN